MLAGRKSELLLDRVQLRMEQGVLARQLEHARLQQQVRDSSLLSRPLGCLIVLPAPIPVGLIFSRVWNELALLPRAQNIVVGRLVDIFGQVDHAYGRARG